MQRFIKLFLALAVCWLGGPLYAQFASNGCPPGMINEGFGCRYGDSTGQPKAPRPKEAVDVHVAVALHPEANDAWAIWNVRESQGGQAAAEEAVLSDCREVMGDGCAIAGSGKNSSVAIARSPSGFLYSRWSATPDVARRDALDDCSKTLTCKIVHVFTAKPWVEYTDAPGFDELKRHRPNGRNIKGRFGAAIMADTNDPRWSVALWISAGHTTSADALKAAADKCDADSGTQCKANVLNMDGTLAIFQDDRGDVGVLSERDNNAARVAVRERCTRDGVKCTIMELVDVKRPGFIFFQPAVPPKR